MSNSFKIWEKKTKLKNENLMFFENLRELLKKIKNWFIFWILISFFFFVFPIKKPISVLFFEKFVKETVPEKISIVVFSPLTAFLVQAKISLFLGFFFSLPLFTFEILNFVFPALYQKEKKFLISLLLSSFFLFFLGFLFSFFFLIPATFRILYSFALPFGVNSFFELQQSVDLFLGISLACSFLFLLPVFMFLLSFFGLVKVDFWKENFKIVFFLILLFSAIITPDGTGITMAFLTFALTSLYLLGYAFSKVLIKGRK